MYYSVIITLGNFFVLFLLKRFPKIIDSLGNFLVYYKSKVSLKEDFL